MNYQHQVPVVSDPDGRCYVAFGRASWDDSTPVLKPGWLDTNNHRSRPGAEMWPEFFLQSITEAVRVGFVTEKQALEAILDGMP